MNAIAGWVAEHRDLPTIAVDTFEGLTESILDGTGIQTGTHYKAPPTLNGRIQLHRTLPDQHFPILFLHLADDDTVVPSKIFHLLRYPSIVIGSIKACARLLEAANLTAQPLYYHRELISIRIA